MLSTVIFSSQIKKQSISKYGFQDNNPMNYNLVCSTGFYTDNKGKTVPAATEVYALETYFLLKHSLHE